MELFRIMEHVPQTCILLNEPVSLRIQTKGLTTPTTPMACPTNRSSFRGFVGERRHLLQ